MDPKAEYTFQEPRRQSFGLPYEMMQIITQKNTNPVVYSKLISTCNHFSAKRPLLMVERFFYSHRLSQYHMSYKNKEVSWNLESLQASKSKLWITQKIILLRPQLKLTASELINNLYRFDGSELVICDHKLTMQEYMILILSKNLSKVDFFNNTFFNDDGTFASVKSLVDPLQNVEDFC